MNCHNFDNTCGDKVFDSCVILEIERPEFSQIEGSCTNLNEFAIDTYTLIGDLRDATSVSELGDGCLTYPDDFTAADALLVYETEICAIKTQIADIVNGFSGETNITTWGLDLSCLQPDSCSDDIETLKALLQSLITEVCRLNGLQASGTATFSGNASTTVFNIPHGLSFTPSRFRVDAQSSAAAKDQYTTADSTNIIVTFNTPPATATNNIVLRWAVNQ